MNLVLALSLLLAAAPASASRAAANGPASKDVAAVDRVDVEVDHSALLEHQVADAAADSGFYVLEDVTKALTEQHGVRVVDDAEAPRIVVKLAWKDYGSSVYRIEIGVHRPGRELEMVEAFEARCINSTALSEVVVKRLPAALERLGEREAGAEPLAVEPVVTEPVGDAEGHGDDPPVVQPQDDGERRVPLGAMGKAGIGVLAAGAAGMVAGGIVFAQHQRLGDNDEGRRYRDEIDFEPAGVTAMAIGGMALVTGAVLLIVDRGRGRRMRKEMGAEARLWPTTTGFLLTGRF